MTTIKKAQFGSKVAARVAAKATTVKTADKTSAPVKKPAVKRIKRATPASQTGLVNDPKVDAAAVSKQISDRMLGKASDPLAAKVTPKVDPLAANVQPVNDPMAKVVTPSTAKRITRTSKVAVPAAKTAPSLDQLTGAGLNSQTTGRVKRAAATTKKAKPVDAAAVVRSTPAKKVPAPVVGAVKSDIAPAAKKAIKKAADALKDVPTAPAKRVIDVTAKKTVATKKPARRVINVGLPESATPAQAIKTVTSVMDNLSTTAAAKRQKELLDAFDLLVTTIRAEGGKVDAELTLGSLKFDYSRPKNAPKLTKTQKKQELMGNINKLLDKAKSYDLWPLINRGPGGTIVELIPFDKDGSMVTVRAEAGISIKKRVKALIDEAAKHGWVLAVPIEEGKPVIKLYETK